MCRFVKKCLFLGLLIMMSTVLAVGCSNVNGSSPENSGNSSIANSTTGNSSGNLVNNGTVAQQGDWIYYSFCGYYNSNDEGGLYKSKSDGSEKSQLLSADIGCFYINVVGDWIYYSSGWLSENPGIYKIRTDGSENTLIYSGSVSSLCVAGDWIYCNRYDNGNYTLDKMRTDGTEATTMASLYSSYPVIAVEDWVYYVADNGIVNNSKTTLNINKMRTDGSNQSTVISGIYMFYGVADDWLYFVKIDDFLNVYKIRTDGTQEKKVFGLTENSEVFMGSDVNITGDWIYYCENQKDESGLYKIRTDGSEKTKLNSSKASQINIADQWIYYLDMNQKMTYKIRTDGTESQSIWGKSSFKGE